MAEGGGGSCLPAEAFHEPWIVRVVRQQELHGHATVEDPVFCQVDASHSAGAEHAEEPVPAGYHLVHVIVSGRGHGHLQPGTPRDIGAVTQL